MRYIRIFLEFIRKIRRKISRWIRPVELEIYIIEEGKFKKYR